MSETADPVESLRSQAEEMLANGTPRAEVAQFAHAAGQTLSKLLRSSISKAAQSYANRGWFVIPVSNKVPMGGNRWPDKATCDVDTVRKMFVSPSSDGVGVVLGPRSGIIDIECDDPAAEEKLREIWPEMPKTPTFKSTRGLHRIFAHRDGLPEPTKAVFKIGALEFRTGNGDKAAQTVFPPSAPRVWTIDPVDCNIAEIPDDVLERIVDAYAASKPPKQRRKANKLQPSESRMKRAIAYAVAVPGAVSGQRGHDHTFALACKLRAFGLDRNEMLDVLTQWNTTCDPPWNDSELEHKVDGAIEAEPEPMPDRPFSSNGAGGVPGTAPRGGASMIRPNEAGDDPHRLARMFLDHNFRLSNGLQKLAWWQGGYWHWDGLRWVELKKHELLAKLTAFVKAEFDRINIFELENWTPKSEEELPPKVWPVTKSLLNNVDNAVASISALPDSLTMPDWLCGDPPFPAREVLASTKTLLHLPSLFNGKVAGISPTPMLFSANCLKYDYDPIATCPTWLKFVESIWPEDFDSIQCLQEWFGYLLLPDTRQHKLLMLIGPPRSGKGTIVRVLQELLGEGNVASPTLSSLAGPFGLWPMLNKFVALIPDARLSGRDDSVAVVERILSITGEDPQDIHRKNMPTLTGVRMPVRFVLLSNELPNMKDASGAFMTRVNLLRMTQSFVGREDRTLSDRLRGELPGILNWSIEGWRRLNERGYFVQPESADELIADLENLSSPIRQFIADTCHTGPEYEASIETLFHAWQTWCERNHRDHAGTNQTFGKDLRAALPQLSQGQRRDDGTRVRVYKGIGVKIDW